MRGSTLILLGATSILLCAALLLPGRCGDDTAREIGRRILPRLQRSRVSLIRIERRDRIIEMFRGADGWRIRAPVAARADREAVEAILSGAEFLEPIRAVRDVTNPRQLGLAPPEGRLVLGLGKDRITLALGRRDPSGMGVYLSRDSRVFLVDRSFAEAVLGELDRFRDRGLVTLAGADLVQILLQKGKGGYALKRAEDGWRLVADGGSIRARQAPVDSLIGALLGLRARRFLRRAPAVAASDPARLTLIGKRGSTSLAWGAACPGRSAEQAVRVVAGKNVEWSCVDREDVSALLVAGDLLVDRSVTSLKEAELSGIEIRAGGSRLRLDRRGGQWMMTGKIRAGQQQVRAWLAGLRAFRGEPSGVPKGQLTSLGLDPAVPAGRAIILEREGGQREVLRLGSVRAGKVPVRRGDEQAVLWLPSNLGPMFVPDPLRFRSREVLRISPTDLRRVTTRRGGETEDVALSGETWGITRPVRVPADSARMKLLLELLSRLEAASFLSSAPASPPDLTVELALRSIPLAPRDRAPTARQVRISLWRRPGGGCAGRIEGAPPFILSGASCALLGSRRAVRRLLTIRTDQLSKIQLSRAGGADLIVQKRGPSWHQVPGGLIPSARAVKLVEVVKSLSAEEVVRYGVAAMAPALTVRVHHHGSEPAQVCTIDRKGRAIVGGRAVTYRLTPATLGKIRGLVDGASETRAP